MYFKIEPGGTGEQDGLVRVRFCMYLEPDDYGYEKHLVTMTKDGRAVDPKTGLTYTSVDPEGNDPPVEGEDPGETIQQVNPFHNHFAYFDATATDEEVLAVGKAFLHEAYIKWAQDLPLDLLNPPPEFHPGASEIAIACEARAVELGDIQTEVRPDGTD